MRSGIGRPAPYVLRYPEPPILICPRCSDIPECTGDREMVRYGNSEPMPFVEDRRRPSL